MRGRKAGPPKRLHFPPGCLPYRRLQPRAQPPVPICKTRLLKALPPKANLRTKHILGTCLAVHLKHAISKGGQHRTALGIFKTAAEASFPPSKVRAGRPVGGQTSPPQPRSPLSSSTPLRRDRPEQAHAGSSSDRQGALTQPQPPVRGQHAWPASGLHSLQGQRAQAELGEAGRSTTGPLEQLTHWGIRGNVQEFIYLSYPNKITFFSTQQMFSEHFL